MRKVQKEFDLLIGIILHVCAVMSIYIIITQIIEDRLSLVNLIVSAIFYPYALITWYKEYINGKSYK